MTTLDSIHNAAIDLHEAGVIDDTKMEEFDVICKKDRIEEPTDINELRETRRDRMAVYMALRHKDLDYVNNMLSKDLETRTIFNHLTVLETTHPAKAHLDQWQSSFDALIARLQAEGYTQTLLDHISKVLA